MGFGMGVCGQAAVASRARLIRSQQWRLDPSDWCSFAGRILFRGFYRVSERLLVDGCVGGDDIGGKLLTKGVRR